MNLSSEAIGWCDTVVQLRELCPAELNRLGSALVDNGVSTVVSAGFSPERDLQRVELCASSDRIELYHGWGLHPFASLELKPSRQWQKDIESSSPISSARLVLISDVSRLSLGLVKLSELKLGLSLHLNLSFLCYGIRYMPHSAALSSLRCGEPRSSGSLA